jgi:acyl carrier protein
MKQIKKEINKIIKNTLKIKKKNIKLTADNIENWDSIAHLHLIAALEKKFKINFANSEIAKMFSESSILNIIKKKNKSFL